MKGTVLSLMWLGIAVVGYVYNAGPDWLRFNILMSGLWGNDRCDGTGV